MNKVDFIPDTITEQAKKGSSSAREYLYRQYARPIYNICVRMTGDKQQAEDMLHEAFITAFNDLKSLRNESAFGGWLKKIAIRQCLKHRKKESLIIVSTETSGLIEEPEETWMQQISIQQINNAICELPNGCRQIFTLYAVEDWSHKEIAEEMGISESTSKSQYQRARKLLRNKLKKYLNG